jgi:hypothetical protein
MGQARDSRAPHKPVKFVRDECAYVFGYPELGRSSSLAPQLLL